MGPINSRSPGYTTFRRDAALLGRLAVTVQIGFLLLGLSLFLDQARDLISHAQFTWGERRVMAVAAAVMLGGCGLAGWILGQVLRTAGVAMNVLIEGAESAARTNELIEQHLVPALGRIAAALEASSVSPNADLAALRAELAAAQAAGRVGRVMDLRDAMTRHLRGESLHDLDRKLAIWLLNLVEHRVGSRTADAEIAGWVARALDSFGTMSEAEPLRQALPSLRRQAGLCVRCGGPLTAASRTADMLCVECGKELAARRTRRVAPRSINTGDQP